MGTDLPALMMTGQKGQNMVIYSILLTVVAVVLVIKVLKWKISTMSLIWFCKEKFREPTDEEISTYSKNVVRKMFRKNQK